MVLQKREKSGTIGAGKSSEIRGQIQGIMNIAIISDYIYGEFISGQAVFARRLIEGLAPHVDRLIVITTGKKAHIQRQGNIVTYCLNGVHLKKFQGAHLTVNPFSMWKRAFRSENIDLVHAQVPTFPALVAARYCRSQGIPVVFSHHVQAENLLKNMNLESPLLSKGLNTYGLWVYNHADHLIFPSGFAREELLRYGLNRSLATSVISNGVDTRTFKPGECKQPLVLYVGRLMREKNIDTLIRASAMVKQKHPEYRFVVCGDGYLKPKLQELAREVNPDLLFTGRLSDEELVSLYQAASIFVLPSEFELQGIVLLEAMACGAATIASNAPTSAAGELANLLFENRNVADLAGTINSLIENHDETLRLGEKNRRSAVEEHDFAGIIEKHLRIYEDLLGKAAASRVETATIPLPASPRSGETGRQE
jgi:1,2-diacylglycerol 3-alpha-glucosyltransferase